MKTKKDNYKKLLDWCIENNAFPRAKYKTELILGCTCGCPSCSNKETYNTVIAGYYILIEDANNSNLFECPYECIIDAMERI